MPDTPTPASSADDADALTNAAPLSRRAARVAAQNADAAPERRAAAPLQQQQQQPPEPEISDAPGQPQPAPPARPATAPAQPPVPSTPAAAAAESAPRSLAAPSAVPAPGDDSPWIFGSESGAAAPTAPSYSRTSTGAAPTAPAESRATSSATLNDLFSGEVTTEALGAPPPPVNKRKRRIGGWIALGIVLVLLGGIAAGGLWVWNTYEPQIREVMGWEEPKDYEPGMANGEAFVTVDDGDTGSPISQALFDAGVTKTPEAFYDYLIDTGQNPPFVPGVFAMQKQMTSEAALAALMDPANKLENSAQLPEGLTVEQSLDRLAEGTGLPREDFEEAVADPAAYGVEADTLEGWLFPLTYTFDPDVTAEQVIQRLVDQTVSTLDEAGVPEDQRQEILTTASIIQREARYEDDMRKVATVIENRLDPDNQETSGLLQMDSTAQYGYGEMHAGSASTSAEAQYDDNPWNTYVHPGLPVGPISNPGATAINAAMDPEDGDWLYFVTVNLDTGETVFTSNLADHNRAVAQWQAWCVDHPDSGC